MDDEVSEYIAFLSKFVDVDKPRMPKFDLGAYTDNEYLSAMRELNHAYDLIYDEELYNRYLRGE